MTYYSLRELFGAHHLATLSECDMRAYITEAINQGTVWFDKCEGSSVWIRIQDQLRSDTRVSFRGACSRVFTRFADLGIINFSDFTSVPLTDEQRLKLLYGMSLTSLCLLSESFRVGSYRLMFPRFDELIESEFYKKEFDPMVNAAYNGRTDTQMTEIIDKLRGFYSSRCVMPRSAWITQQLAKK